MKTYKCHKCGEPIRGEAFSLFIQKGLGREKVVVADCPKCGAHNRVTLKEYEANKDE